MTSNARQRLQIGFSPCPNDTFTFWALVHGEVACRFAFDPVMADIEALNERALGFADSGSVANELLPVTKLSLPALSRCIDQYAVLQSGAALGFGCGPLVVARPELASLDAFADARVAIPGEHTTAFLLLSTLLPKPREVVAMRFDEIMPAVAAGRCDAGLVIHESRFTFGDHGLIELCDLGVLWEEETGGPLPLGVIAARRDLGDDVVTALETGIADSVRFAQRFPARPLPWIRQHAQEMADDVCARHIELYVNSFTEDLGQIGRGAIDQLLLRGREAGLLPAGRSAYRDRG